MGIYLIKKWRSVTDHEVCVCVFVFVVHVRAGRSKAAVHQGPVVLPPSLSLVPVWTYPPQGAFILTASPQLTSAHIKYTHRRPERGCWARQGPEPVQILSLD